MKRTITTAIAASVLFLSAVPAMAGVTCRNEGTYVIVASHPDLPGPRFFVGEFVEGQGLVGKNLLATLSAGDSGQLETWSDVRSATASDAGVRWILTLSRSGDGWKTGSFFEFGPDGEALRSFDLDCESDSSSE